MRPQSRLLSGHAGELSVGRVVEIGPHEQADADEREVETAFAERHEDTGGGTEEDTQDGDHVGVDAEEIEEARPQQTDGAGEIDVNVFFGVGAFEGGLQVRVFSHGNRKVTLGAVVEKVEGARGDGLGGGLGAATKGGPVVEIDEEEAPVGTNDWRRRRRWAYRSGARRRRRWFSSRQRRTDARPARRCAARVRIC